MPRQLLPRSAHECSNPSAGTTPGWPRSCATTFRWSSEVGSGLDLHARPHAHVNVVVVVDLPQCPRRRMPDRADFVSLRRRQPLAGTRALDFAERPGRGRTDVLVAILQGAPQRLHRPIILDFAEGPRGQGAHFGRVLLQL